jgi:hypothetical protein
LGARSSQHVAAAAVAAVAAPAPAAVAAVTIVALVSAAVVAAVVTAVPSIASAPVAAASDTVSSASAHLAIGPSGRYVASSYEHLPTPPIEPIVVPLLSPPCSCSALPAIPYSFNVPWQVVVR